MAAIPLGMANMPHCCAAGIATIFSTPFMQMRYSTPLCVCAAVFASAMAMSTHLGVPNEESTNGETHNDDDVENDVSSAAAGMEVSGCANIWTALKPTTPNYLINNFVDSHFFPWLILFFPSLAEYLHEQQQSNFWRCGPPNFQEKGPLTPPPLQHGG